MKRVSNVFKLGWRRRYLTAAALALAASFALYVSSALGDAGNPILGTIHGSIVDTSGNPNDSDTRVTVYVRGQWNWLSHGSDCNVDRAATGVGIIWSDPTEPGYTVTKGSISAGVGISALRPGDTDNKTDQMVHPADRGNIVEGLAGPAGQAFNDPSPPGVTTTQVNAWKGGCGRVPLTTTQGIYPAGGGPQGEATGLPCANGATTCSGHPWGSYGYETALNDGNGQGYKHVYAKRADVTTVCVNFYDVHGKNQVPGGTKEITVNANGDNSIQTNAFNVNQGANCITFPGITTSAVTPVTVGSNITDTATVSGRTGQTSWVRFHLFLPSDPNCTGTDQYSGGRKSVSGNGSVTSDPVQTTATGDYHWTAELFDAQTGGNLLATTSCGVSGETSHVNPAHPSIVTFASGPVTIGQSISDKATLSGGFNPTGTITFTAYAPLSNGNADTLCSTSVYTKTVTVSGNGDYLSGFFTPSGTAAQIAGTYEWVASYSGDGNNVAASTSCGDSGEQSVVNRHLSTVPTGQKVVISDFAQVTSTIGTPTGTVDFQLYQEPSSNCTANLIYDSGPVTLDANGRASTVGLATQPPPLSANATYSWQVTYTPASGSSFTESSSSCGTEQTTISGNTPGVDP